MSDENNKMQVDIENLFKQNVNDLSSIKELYRKLKEIEQKISQIKYIDNTLVKKLKKEYEKLKEINFDVDLQIKLTNDIESINSQLDTINSQLDTIANKGTTVEVLERVTKEEINRQIADGTIANLTIADGSITQEKLSPELKLAVEDEGILAKNYLSGMKNDVWGLTETTITGTGTSSKLNSYSSFAEFKPTTNKTLYFKVKAKVLESGCEKIQAIISGTSGTKKVVEIVRPVANKEYELSLSDNLLNHKGSATNVSINAIYPNKETQSGKHLIYSCGVVLDLTETFGEGNEPNTKVIDCLLTKFNNKHFYGTENIFSSNVVKTLRNDLYSYKGEYIKTNELGNILIGSVPNVKWENWQLDQYSYGMSKHDIVPIYNYIHGTLESDAMFSVWAKYSRWSPDCVYSTEGGHQWGGHIFEGWNRPRTYRYTVLIGKNAVDETCIFTFAPPSQEVEGEEGGGGTFGITRVGSDKPKEGFEIKQKEATMNGSLKITEKLMIPYKNITISTTEGERGQIAYNENYLFLCVKDNYWKRVPLESF